MWLKVLPKQIQDIGHRSGLDASPVSLSSKILRGLCGLAVATLCLAPLPSLAGPYDAQFNRFLQGTVVPAARKAGVSDATLRRELSGLTLDTSLPGLTRPGGGGVPKVNFQAEFGAPGRYFSDSQFNGLVAAGRPLLARYRAPLKQIEARYGVPGRIILAIWARETGYGSARIPYDAVRTLASQAFMGQRAPQFLPELVDALKILDADHIRRSEMKSSWGGAMGQPQFLPSSFLKYAVDFDGDGKRDIWNSPVDAMASIANFLAAHGWVRGRDWGYEVDVPQSVSCANEGPDRGEPISSWIAKGVKRVEGREFSAAERSKEGFLLMPAGRYGPAFLATENFYVLKDYNTSDVYALFVGHLADRYGHNVGFAANWKPTRKTTRGHVRDLQLALQKKGYDVGGADGLIGYKTRRSIGEAQQKAGKPATCWID